MSLNDIFSARLLDHYKYPRHFGGLEDADVTLDGANPQCGDEITLQVKTDGEKIEKAGFTGTACAICIASSSMFCERAVGSSLLDLDNVKSKLYDLLHGKELDEASSKELGEMMALEGVSKLSSRVKCATLIWETWQLARKQLSTEVESQP